MEYYLSIRQANYKKYKQVFYYKDSVMRKAAEECPILVIEEDQKSFFYDFLMSIKGAQEEGREDCYKEILDLLLDSKQEWRNKKMSIRVGEISEILNIPNPFEI
jgi:hypothetical protein